MIHLLRSILNKLGLAEGGGERHPIRVFLLDDDKRRHDWFAKRFKGDFLDVAVKGGEAERKCLIPAGSNDIVRLMSEELMRGGPHRVYLRAMNSVRSLL